MPGEIHCLLGAGKSTLLKIIAGAHRLDAGEILIAGEKSSFSNPVEAARAGISMIYQELDLIPQLTVAENLFWAGFLINMDGSGVETASSEQKSWARSCDRVFISMQSTTIPGALCRQTSNASPKKSWVRAEI
jgi:ABC-type sugar transport system ATPase subunit